MINEIPYFLSLTRTTTDLERHSNHLNELLTDAFSAKPLASPLPTHIDQVLAEESQIQDLCALINQQIATGTLLPITLDDTLLPRPPFVPSWFPHVVEEQYSARREELEREAAATFKVHELQQKRKTLFEQRSQLEILYRRFLSLSQFQRTVQGFSEINILEEVAHLKQRVNHVQKAYQHFCLQITNKITSFIHHLALKSKSFTQIGNREESTPHFQRNLPITSRHSPRDPFSKEYRSRDVKSPIEMRMSPKQTIHPMRFEDPYGLGEGYGFEDKVQRQFHKLQQHKKMKQKHFGESPRNPIINSNPSYDKTSYKLRYLDSPLDRIDSNAKKSEYKHDHLDRQMRSNQHYCASHMQSFKVKLEPNQSHHHTCGRQASPWMRAVTSADKLRGAVTDRLFSPNHHRQIPLYYNHPH